MGKFNIKKNYQGGLAQSLVELIIGMAIGGILIGISTGAIVLLLRSNYDTRTTQIAVSLAQDYLDNINAIVDSNWHNIYDLGGKGSSSQFHLAVSGATYAILPSSTSTMMEGKSFTRYFSVENVNRDGSGNIVETGGSEDPSTQKVAVTVNWEGNRTISKTQYLTRYRNISFIQTDWVGGPNQESFSTSSVNNKFSSSTNINYTASSGVIKIQGY